jgi:8-oxo-dGTP pyrophosphatase MutT (NUDIX family)
MVRQPRTGNGEWNCEFPAGMLDLCVDDPLGTAIRELREETGICLKQDQLTCLYSKKLYTSVGLSDEAVYYYGALLEVDDAVYTALHGSAAGAVHESETIEVMLLSEQQVREQAVSAQVLLGLELFLQRRRSGTLPQISYSQIY